ncbi:hypothetical protein HK098_005464 [Nowakowskiella sp. JEL0407]|nr:hypothetical protein HK098_005464 [Nowakowskiella sp. JEL0407]
MEWAIHTFGYIVVYSPSRIDPIGVCTSQYPEFLTRTILIIASIVQLIWTSFVISLVVNSKHSLKNTSFSQHQNLWVQRLRKLTFGMHLNITQGNDMLSNVAKEMAYLFHDVDWAPSDILAGMVLIKRDQKRKKYESVIESTSPSVTAPESMFPGKQEISDILYFYRYAELAYLPSQFQNLIDPKELIKVSLQNDLYKPPFVVVFDHDVEVIVVSIRGTYSLADIFSDFKMDLKGVWIEELRNAGGGGVGNGALQSVHDGMLKSAENVLSEIDVDKLKKLLLDPESAYCGYRLVVCGHSLGAGVAALLTWKLRTLGLPAHCYSYAPPGCLMSPLASEYFKEFCVSIVIGDDIVPRLTRNSIEVLKWEIGRLLSTCEIHKYQILKSVIARWWKGSKNLRIYEGRRKRRQLREEQKKQKRDARRKEQERHSQSELLSTPESQEKDRVSRNDSFELHQIDVSSSTPLAKNSQNSQSQSQDISVSTTSTTSTPKPTHQRKQRLRSVSVSQRILAKKNRHYHIKKLSILPMTNEDGTPKNHWIQKIMALRQSDTGFERVAWLPTNPMHLPGKVLYLEKLRKGFEYRDEEDYDSSDEDDDPDHIPSRPQSIMEELIVEFQQPSQPASFSIANQPTTTSPVLEEVEHNSTPTLKPHQIKQQQFMRKVKEVPSEIISGIQKQASKLPRFQHQNNNQQPQSDEAEQTPTMERLRARDRPLSQVTMNLLNRPNSRLELIVKAAYEIAKVEKKGATNDTLQRIRLEHRLSVSNLSSETIDRFRAGPSGLNSSSSTLDKFPIQKQVSSDRISLGGSIPSHRTLEDIGRGKSNDAISVTSTVKGKDAMRIVTTSSEVSTGNVVTSERKISSAGLSVNSNNYTIDSDEEQFKQMNEIPESTKGRGRYDLFQNKTEKKKKREEKYVYRPRWATKEEFTELAISSTSVADHFRFDLFRELEKLEDGKELCVEPA